MPGEKSGIVAEGDSDEEETLPGGWEERTTDEGRVYYANHAERTTQWTHPRTGQQKRLLGDLPPGWQRVTLDDGRCCFVNHSQSQTTFTDPRLAFAVATTPASSSSSSSSLPAPPRQRFDASSTWCVVLSGEDLKGKTVLITGASSGIGLETAKALAAHNAHVVLACRDLQAAERAKAVIEEGKHSVPVDFLHCDLASLASVRECAENFLARFSRLDVLILNAGYLGGAELSVTGDGFERTFAINHLGHAYLTRLLCCRLLSSAPARIVALSSEAHRFSLTPITTADDITLARLSVTNEKQYWSMDSYATSKLCVLLYALALNRRLIAGRVVANAVHPGNMVATGLPRRSRPLRLLYQLARPFTKTLSQAASTSAMAAAAVDFTTVGGQYLNNCWFSKPAPLAFDLRAQDRLWLLTEHLLTQFQKDLPPIIIGN